MMIRLIYCFTLLLMPTLVLAQEASGDLPAAQSAPAITAPIQHTPVKPATPTSPASAPAEQAKPIQTTPAAPIIVLPAQRAPATPAQPAPVQRPAPKLTAPLAASATQIAPVQRTPVKPAFPQQLSKPQLSPVQPLAKPAIAVQSAPVQAASSPVKTESPADTSSQIVDIEVFVREGCTQCDKATDFLDKLRSLRPQLKINVRDVRKEPAALALLKRMTQNEGAEALDYPAFVMAGQLIIGFSEEANTAQLILDKLAANNPNSQKTTLDAENCKTGKELSCGVVSPAQAEKPEKITLNFLGYSIPLAQIGMPLFTLAMGLLDGFNHGSIWVLILMISLLAPMKNRTAMLAVAGTFIAVQGILYFIVMSLWLNIFIMTGTSRISEIVIASIALLAAAVYFKNYMYFGRSIALSSHEISKPGIYTRIRKILQAESLATALMGSTVLAVLVQLSEFSYKSIFPAMYTRVLTLQQLDSLSNYGFLLLYDVAYMLDDIIVLTVAVITLKQSQEKVRQGPLLFLINGLVLACLAAYMTFSLR